jgi:pyridoxal 5'-phosphate synthase pdxT subunit
MKVGVLALQGSFAEHARALRRAGAEPVLVRTRAEMDGVSGLIIPGGESTTIGKLMVRTGLKDLVRERISAGMPTWGTCAGMIILAKDIGEGEPPHLAVMDIRVRRNAFGRQLDSFEEALSIPALGAESYRGVFIRAPLIEAAGAGVTVLATLPDGRAVAAQQDNLLASAFHPELTDDDRMHRHFLEMIDRRILGHEAER